MNYYYFITTFTKYDDYGPHGLRCWGFYKEFHDAEEDVINNNTDLWETCYNYCVIEKYHEGISGYAWERWFYKYNQETNKYEPIQEPEELEHYYGFAMG